jgi:hypothetical protein
MKDQWYKTTEAILYEYKTLDSAIMHLKRRGDAEKLHAKEQLKKDLDAIILKLPKHEQDFIEHVYG